MHLTVAFLLLPFLTSTALGQTPNKQSRSKSRSIDASLVEPQELGSSQSTPILKNLDLSTYIKHTPFIKHLDLRQVAAPVAQPVAGTQQQAAQPAANANANANANTNANTDTNANANTNVEPAAQPVTGTQQQAAPDTKAAKPATNQQQVAAPVAAPAVPVAGVGGGAGPAAAQPAPGAQANPVTTALVQTVIGGVTTQIPTVYTQSFGVGNSAPSVKSGSIGMGTLTGKVGVLKTDSPKSDAVPTLAGSGIWWAMLGIIGSWTLAMALSGAILGMRLT